VRTVWKHPIWVEDRQTVVLPEGAQILTVWTQDEQPCLWALVDDQAEYEGRTIITHGTGHPAEEPGLEYIGTYHLKDGALVFHVFEEVGAA
jgi:hypothetical protein